MSSAHIAIARSRRSVRRLLLGGTALPLALLAVPAQAECVVDGSTTTCTSTGNVSTIADGAPAILALGDEVTVSNTGDLTTTGISSGGIVAVFNYTYDPVEGDSAIDVSGHASSVTSVGNISTALEDSYGIAAAAINGPVSVNSTGNITTAGEDSYGIVASGQTVSVVSDGTISTSGETSHGIFAPGLVVVDGETEAMGGVPGDITIEAGTVSTSGVASMGIRAFSENGSVSITADSVTTTGEGDDESNFAEAVFGESNNGSVTLDIGSAEAHGYATSSLIAISGGTATITADSATNHGDSAANVYAKAAGNVNVSISTITSAGNGEGAALLSTGGAVDFSADTISVGDFGLGAYVRSVDDTTVAVGTITGGAGINAQSSAGDISVTATSIDTWSYALNLGTLGGGNIVVDAGDLVSKIDSTSTLIADAQGGGSIEVDVDQASSAGNDRATLYLTTGSGDINVTGGAITASGNAGLGVYAHTADGDISVNLGSVATTGVEAVGEHVSEGILADSINGTSTVVVGTASSEGYGASAAVALGGAGASVTADIASGSGEGAAILYAGSLGGNATVDAGTVTLRGNNQGAANAQAEQGVATISIDTVIDAGTLSTGVIARGGQGANVTAGDITVDRNGVWANALNGSAATIVTTGDTTTSTGYGLRGTGGIVSISTAEGTTTQAGHHAIWAQGTDSIVIDNQGTASTNGGLSSAIFAQSGGDVSITSAIAHALGDGADPGIGEDGFRIAQGGIVANGVGAVSIDADTVTVEGEYRYGIHAFGGEGVTINADNVTLASADSAAVSGNSGAGAVNITTGTVTTTGISGAGVVARTDSGDITIVADTTRVESGGIQGPFTGDAVAGISSSGNVSVTSNDAFSAAYGGSAAVALGGSATVNSGLAETTGDNGIALYALAYAGDASVTADQTLVSGDDAMGIFAGANQGIASVFSHTLASTGTVNTSGIYARAPNGDAIIVTTGDTTVAGGYALRAEGEKAWLATAEGSLTQAAGNAIWAQGVQSASVENLGTARSTGYGSAIFAESGGAIAITSVNAEATGPGIDPGADDNGMRWPQGGIIASADGAVSIDADTVSIEGEYRYGIHAFGGEGVTITANDVTLASADSVAVAGKSDAGAVSITTGTVVTTGASGVGVLGETASGDITIVAGTTRVENGGMAGPFTGEAIAGMSDSGNVSITSEDAFTAAFGGSAIVGYGGSVTIDSGRAETTGADGTAVLARSFVGDATVTAAETLASGAGTYAILSRADQGNSTIHVGTLTSTSDTALGGAVARAAGAATIVTTGDVKSAGGFALRAQGATALIETGEGTLTQGGAMGIQAIGTSAASVFNGGIASGVTHGINATAAGDVTIDSLAATASGANGFGIFGQSNTGTLTIDAHSVTTTGADSTAIQGFAFNGPSANIRVDDITATGANASGVFASGRNVNVTVDGAVNTTGRGILASGGVESHVTVNGSVAASQADAVGVISISHHSVVEIAEGASVSAGGTGVVLLGNSIGGFSEFYNSGEVHGETGAAVFAGQTDPSFAPANYYLQNNGVLTSNGPFVVVTGAGEDTLELTNLSQITGIVNLGEGQDRLVLDLNDDAPAGAVGQVASTINVESLHVDSGSWLANGVQSQYGLLEVEEGATLTIVENEEGSLAIEAEVVELDGRINVDLSVDDTEEDFGQALVTGIGSLHLIGTATVILSDASNLQHTGGTYVENGTLQLTGAYAGNIVTSGTGTFELGDGGTTGDFTGDIVNNGTFVFSRSDDYSLLGDFTGTGSLIKNGAGVLTFAGLYDFTGTTTVNGGRIAFLGELSEDTEVDLSGDGVVDLSQIQSGQQEIAQLSGDGGTVVLGTTNLVVNQTSNTVFEGAVSGTSTLTKTGEGDLKLNGDGTNFTGTGEVQGGTLSVNGNFSNASFVVEPGGTLGGSGTVGATSVNGGTLAAGNSIGQLTVNGDLTLTAASVLEVEVNAAGQADRVDATGSAALGGATVNVLAEAGNYAPVTDYTILTAAGGFNGSTFGAVNSNLAYLVPLLSYTVNTVTLRLERNDVDFSAYTTDPNSIVVGGLIESLGYGTPLYNTALMLSTTQAATDFATLTGDIYPVYSASLVETANAIRQQTAKPMGSGAGAYAWGQGLAGSMKADGNGGRGFKASNTGVAGGLGFAGLGFDVSAGLGQLWQDPSQSQVTDSDITFALLQAAYNGPAGFYANGGVQLGWVDAAASRATQLGTLSTTVTSEFDAKYTNLNAEVGMALPLVGVSVQPFAGLSHVSLNIDGFSETGGATALTVGDLDRDVTFGDLGVRVKTAIPGPFSAYGSAAYRMAWGDRASTGRVAFAGNTAGGLVSGLPLAKSAAEIGAGIRYNAGRIGIGLEYNGTFSKAFDSNNVSAKLSIAF